MRFYRPSKYSTRKTSLAIHDVLYIGTQTFLCVEYGPSWPFPALVVNLGWMCQGVSLLGGRFGAGGIVWSTQCGEDSWTGSWAVPAILRSMQRTKSSLFCWVHLALKEESDPTCVWSLPGEGCIRLDSEALAASPCGREVRGAGGLVNQLPQERCQHCSALLVLRYRLPPGRYGTLLDDSSSFK